MQLLIAAWSWGTKYSHHYVMRLQAGIQRNLRAAYQFRIIRATADDAPFLDGCFIRLKMFDPRWQKAQGIPQGVRIVCMDLDTVITGPLDPLFEREEDFVILQGVNAANPCPYNGSLWMLRAGYRPDVWLDFSLKAARQVPHYRFPDDQAWLAHKLPGAAAYTPHGDGVYGFQKPGWTTGDELPENARIVAFFGSRDPAQFTNLAWVREHWR